MRNDVALDQTEKLYQRTVPVSGRIYSFDNVSKKYSMPVTPVRGKIQCFNPHIHEDVELITVFKGTVYMTLDQEQIAVHESETVIANSYVVHEGYIRTDEPFVQYSFCRFNIGMFSMMQVNQLSSVIGRISAGLLRFPTKVSELVQEKEGLQTHISRLNDAFREAEAGNFSPRLICNLYAAFFTLLSDLLPLAVSPKGEHFSELQIDFINKVSHYLDENYASPVSPQDIATHLSYSKSNFYRLFQRCFRMSPTVYLCRYRITRAASDYRNTGLPIYKISRAVGFTNYGYFSKTFKKYIGISPNKYFSKNAKYT